MEQSLTKKILKVCAASLLAVSSFFLFVPCSLPAFSPENYLIKSFAWEQYESFVNTGASTLFENPKVYYFSAGSLAKTFLKIQPNLFKNTKDRKSLLKVSCPVTHLLNPLLSLMLLIISSLSISEWERITTLKTHPSLREKFLLSGSQRKRKTK